MEHWGKRSLILAYGTSRAAPLGQKYTRKYLHASDYSVMTARIDIFALAHNKTFAFFDLTQHPAVPLLDCFADQDLQ